jgi:hypothetical protein
MVKDCRMKALLEARLSTKLGGVYEDLCCQIPNRGVKFNYIAVLDAEGEQGSKLREHREEAGEWRDRRWIGSSSAKAKNE